MQTQHPVELAIVSDVRNRTGLSFVQIGAINTRDKGIASAVLPILKEWVPRVTEPNLRGAIFHRFGPHSSSYIDSLLEWWQAEDDQINAGLLTQAIVEAAKPAHAEILWELARHEQNKPFYFMLLAKLATFPRVAEEVRDTVAKALEDGKIPTFELPYVAQVDDLRIRRWFEEQVESPDAKVRQLARRVAAKGKKLPANVAVSPVPPDRSREIFSIEIDLVDIRETMKKIADRLALKIPAPLQTASFLSSVQVDQWVNGHIKGTGGEVFDLWLRLEDVDTVEILVTRSSKQPPPTVQ